MAALLAAVGLVVCGVAGGAAWQRGLWGSLAGSTLAAIWLGLLNWWAVVRPRSVPAGAAAVPDTGNAVVLRVLLDAAPTPLLGIDGAVVHALNRAARRLFATDDRVLPVPTGLLDLGTTHLRHEGRGWRIDRVAAADAGPGRVVAALIDIEQEERTAEARATAELIQVLGHELLNGLAPIVSLADSGLAVVQGPAHDPALLAEILGTLARRAEGLQRFTIAYRALARLPAPTPLPVSIRELADDLARLFAGRWPGMGLTVNVSPELHWPLDRDQVSQAVWALLQNAAEAAAVDRVGDAHVVLAGRRDALGLSIEVQDNGGGIPADGASRIFRPFHTTKPDGTGIGLSLARQIAHAHGGTLTLEPATQTLFRLFLPDR